MSVDAKDDSDILVPFHPVIASSKNSVSAEVVAETFHDVLGDAIEAGVDNMIAGELSMARDILRELVRNFPGYRWRVMVNFRQGVAGISLPIFMGPVQMYAITLTKMMTANGANGAVKEAGGHILERLRLNRSGLKLPEFLDLREQMRVIKPLDKIPE